MNITVTLIAQSISFFLFVVFTHEVRMATYYGCAK